MGRIGLRDEFELIEYFLEEGELEKSLEQIRHLESRPESLQNKTVVGRAKLLAAEIQYRRGEYQKSIECATKSIEILRSTAEHSLYGQAKCRRGYTYLISGNPRKAIDDFSEALYTYRRARNVDGELHACNSLARCHYIEGRYQKAREVLQDSLHLARSIADPERILAIRANLGRVSVRIGDFHGGAEYLRLEEQDGQLESPANSCRRNCSLGYVLMMTRDFAEADTFLTVAKEIASKHSLAREQSIYHEYAGELAFWQGDYDQAEQHYREAIKIGMKIAPEGDLISQSYRLLAELQVARGEYTEAVESCDRACTVAEKISERLELGAIERTRGRIAVLRKNESDARRHFENAIKILGHIGAKYELARAHLTAGEAAVFDTHYRLTNLIAARLLFDTIGVEYWQGRVAGQISALVHEPAGAPRHVSPGGAKPNHDGKFIAASQRMIEILERLERVKNTDLTILLLGETGAGKDQLARYIHETSSRADRPFQPIFAVAIPADLWESELFGHRRGAFTGANDDKIGLLEQADGGTVYLNEVSEIPPRLQAKMLEFLETKTIQRLGETEKRVLDIRFIAASNRDLNEEIDEKRFRDDLFFRLNQLPVVLPPLREREGEIAALTRYFLTGRGLDPYLIERFLASEVFAVMNRAAWPGNVRQLEYVIDRIAALSANEKLPYLLTVAKEILVAEGLYHFEERDELVNALVANDWNQRETARALDVSEATIRHRMKRLAIYRPTDNG